MLGFITNRGFLTGRGFGGLRRMLRRRFDAIRVLDLRGDSQGTRRATVAVDENVFNIRVGVCILIAYATGNQPEGAEAEVRYADAWDSQAFTRSDKLASQGPLWNFSPIGKFDVIGRLIERTQLYFGENIDFIAKATIEVAGYALLIAVIVWMGR